MANTPDPWRTLVDIQRVTGISSYVRAPCKVCGCTHLSEQVGFDQTRRALELLNRFAGNQQAAHTFQRTFARWGRMLDEIMAHVKVPRG